MPRVDRRTFEGSSPYWRAVGIFLKNTRIADSVAPQKIGRGNMRRFPQAQNCQKFFTNRR
jgi:hypothetical protein